MVVAGGVLLLAVCVLGRRGDEARWFTCAIGAVLVLTPVMWLHYLALLAVPLGIVRPRFSAIWLLPIVLWVCPRAGNGDGLQSVLPLLVVLLIVLALNQSPRGGMRAAEAPLRLSPCGTRTRDARCRPGSSWDCACLSSRSGF